MTMEKIRRDVSEFIEKAKLVDIFGIGTAFYCDHETAISLADRFVNRDNFFLLESATAGPGNVARYSFMGFDPIWQWDCTGNKGSLLRRETVSPIELSGLEPISEMYQEFRKLKFASQFNTVSGTHGIDLSAIGGTVGFIGFDVSAKIEPKIGKPPVKKLGLPDMIFQIPQTFMVLDQLSRQLHVYRYIDVGGKSESDLAKLYDLEIDALEKTIEELAKPHTPPPIKTKNEKIDFEKMTSTFAKGKFFKAAEFCLNEIRNGEIFQVQIGNRMSSETKARPFDIFRHLRMINPSPYMFFYKFGGHHVVGASPEMMVNIEGEEVVHRPIAGTRKRTWNSEKDRKMKKELVESEKERAEHIMLVDLSRNDIGRIAKAGTVKVDELMIVEEYSHVFHMVSQVSCKMREDTNPGEVMALSFPNGTVSGAPKIRAMEIIYDLEPVSREYYAGSLALFDFSGDLKSTILIRSMHIKDGIASTHASAGIVYDSIVEQEWLETRNKMAACVTAIQNTL